jgi:phosphatidylethanolamine-binding protein (PEBP) family uncharacterized protein
MLKPFFATALLCIGATAAQADMQLSFNWGNIPKCTTGNPNKVGNPIFRIKDLPEGTTKLIFKLVDLDAPNYKHGGGTVKNPKSGDIASGLFKYKSPCPPNGQHTYVWSVIAKAGSKTLAKAQASRKYPE